MSTALEPRDAARDLANTIRSDQFKQQVAIALPEGVNPDRFVRVMATALLDNPDIAVKADINSVFQAGLKAAQDGLMPDGREAAFVLFKDQCAYLPMVGGLRKIAAEYGWTIRSAVVYANDEFEYEEGLEPRLVHRPVRPGGERGEKIAAYAVATHKDGRKEFEVMDAADIAKRRAVARTQVVWNQWEEQMWEKTPTKRLFQKLSFDGADKARIDRVLSAAELGPEGATRALYGGAPVREDRIQLPPIPPAPSDPDMPVVDAEGRRAAEPQEEPQPPAAAASAPDFDGEEPAEETRFEAPASVAGQAAPSQAELLAAGAGETRFLSGKHKGRTIREVYESEASYIKWAASAWKTPDFKAALVQYVANQEPGA